MRASGGDARFDQAFHDDLRSRGIERSDQRYRKDAVPQFNDGRREYQELFVLIRDNGFARLRECFEREESEAVDQFGKRREIGRCDAVAQREDRECGLRWREALSRARANIRRGSRATHRMRNSLHRSRSHRGRRRVRRRSGAILVAFGRATTTARAQSDGFDPAVRDMLAPSIQQCEEFVDRARCRHTRGNYTHLFFVPPARKALQARAICYVVVVDVSRFVRNSCETPASRWVRFEPATSRVFCRSQISSTAS